MRRNKGNIFIYELPTDLIGEFVDDTLSCWLPIFEENDICCADSRKLFRILLSLKNFDMYLKTTGV